MVVVGTKLLVIISVFVGLLVYVFLFVDLSQIFVNSASPPPTLTTPPTHTPTPAPTPLPTPLPTPPPTPRTPRIAELVVTARDSDTTASWEDDDNNLRYVTVLVTPDFNALQALRGFVGSIHDYEKEAIKTTVFGCMVHQDFYEEIRTFSFVRFIDISGFEGDSEAALTDKAFSISKQLYSRFLLFSPSAKMVLQAEGIAKEIKEYPAGPINVTIDGNVNLNVQGYVRGDGPGKVFEAKTFLSTDINMGHGTCALLRNITSVFRTRFIYANDNDNFIMKEDKNRVDDKLVCLSIATYSGSNPISIDDFSLFKHVLPTFLSTTTEVDGPDSRYRYAMYLGTQRDPFFDDPEKMQQVIEKLESATKDRSFSLRIFETPLNAPAIDITYKWNALIDQSYRDGCDYIYQYSDDTEFMTPWVDQFVRYLEAESNFGVVGATDTRNGRTMTLSFAHRNHISILGSYWPTHLKNWYSDDWAQQVYGTRYTLYSKEVIITNTQTHGQRYQSCEHEGLHNQLMTQESRPRILAWLRLQPQTYDIRQKVAYFENNAQGDKKRDLCRHNCGGEEKEKEGDRISSIKIL